MSRTERRPPTGQSATTEGQNESAPISANRARGPRAARVHGGRGPPDASCRARRRTACTPPLACSVFGALEPFCDVDQQAKCQLEYEAVARKQAETHTPARDHCSGTAPSRNMEAQNGTVAREVGSGGSGALVQFNPSGQERFKFFGDCR